MSRDNYPEKLLGARPSLGNSWATLRPATFAENPQKRAERLCDTHERSPAANLCGETQSHSDTRTSRGQRRPRILTRLAIPGSISILRSRLYLPSSPQYAISR